MRPTPMDACWSARMLRSRFGESTPGEGWIATLLGNPVIRPLTRFAYDRFADLLYAWNRRKGTGIGYLRRDVLSPDPSALNVAALHLSRRRSRRLSKKTARKMMPASTIGCR